MHLLLTESNWGFGTLELISLISALATMFAVVVSLFLALKSNTIKCKIRVNNKMLGLQIINTGNTKFFVHGFGISVKKYCYMNSCIRIMKLLSRSKQISEHSMTNQEFFVGKTLLEPGDVAETCFCDFDCNLLITKKSFMICVINDKIKRIKIDVRCVEIQKGVNNQKYEMIQLSDLKNKSFLYM